jgi:hypothetical protein
MVLIQVSGDGASKTKRAYPMKEKGEFNERHTSCLAIGVGICLQMADFVAEVGCWLARTVIPSL